MSDSAIRANKRLRDAAEDLLAGGKAPPTQGWGVSEDALTMLCRLAGDQKSDVDALTLLHELQVHQVELDLQLQQYEINEAELTEAVRDYRDRFELAPVSYLLLDRDGRIVEANRTALRWFLSAVGSREADAPELRLDSLIEPGDRPRLAAMLNQLGDDQPTASCEVAAIDAPAGAPTLRLSARLDTDHDTVWIVVS